ncbi:unnamed protein product [Rotaria socialis]|uniref:ADP ribosyltransferase domain-containing protein n=1 Tax=Rotaria socialis TaxID=392032 RepID=A0A821GVQ1_9BILA|nr:unnamed protein product [Rotaria socialis]CAF4669875.1 unnamed protein product [Rotaria socialis]
MNASLTAASFSGVASTTSRFRGQDTTNLEPYQFLWFDKEVNATEDNLVKEEARQVINHMRVFDNFEECERYVELVVERGQKIILIVSGYYGRELISRVQNIPQVAAVYVYCMNEDTYREWSKSYKKVNIFFTKPNELINQLKQDQHVRERTYENSLAMNIYSHDHSGNSAVQEQRDRKNASFMYFIIFIDILLTMLPNDDKARRELSQVWSEYCNANFFSQNVVKEFEKEYESQKAIWWYTRESFLYRILNKALRESDIDLLFGLRFFLCDLYRQITDEHVKFLNSYTAEDPILRVYRGQAMGLAELNLIQKSKGEFITFNNFLSTSTNRQIATIFADSSAATLLAHIILEFEIDTRLPDTKCYADISKLSYFQNENEILIRLGSIFRIDDVKYDEHEQLWIAKLRLCSEDSYELKDMLLHMKESIGNGIISLGIWFEKQGDNEKARQFFRGLLAEESISDVDRTNCYRGLGTVAQRQEEYDEALKYYQQELCIELTLGNDVFVATTYSKIGEVYWRKRELDMAMSFEQKALDIFLPLNHPQLSNVYRTMANIYKYKNKSSLSIEYFEKALDADREYFPENHSQFGITYTNMGLVHDKDGKYEEALKCYTKASEIFVKSLPANHPNILQLEINIRFAKSKLDQK